MFNTELLNHLDKYILPSLPIPSAGIKPIFTVEAADVAKERRRILEAMVNFYKKIIKRKK